MNTKCVIQNKLHRIPFHSIFLNILRKIPLQSSETILEFNVILRKFTIPFPRGNDYYWVWYVKNGQNLHTEYQTRNVKC